MVVDLRPKSFTRSRYAPQYHPPEANERLVHLKNHRFLQKTNHYVNQTFTIVCSMVIFRDVSNGLNWHCWSFNIFPLGEPSTCEAVRYFYCANVPRNKFYQWVGFQGMCLGNHKDKYEIHKNRVHIYIYMWKYIQCIFINIYIYNNLRKSWLNSFAQLSSNDVKV